MLRRVSDDLSKIPSPGELKEDLQDIKKQLERTRATFRRCSLANAMIIFKDGSKETAFLEELDQLIDAAKFHHDALVVRPGSRQWDMVKAMAAKYADELLRSFGDKPPTKTEGGAFYMLASLLYRGATGATGVNLQQYCRDLDRVEPSIVVKVPYSDH